LGHPEQLNQGSKSPIFRNYVMKGQPAKVLAPADVRKLLRAAGKGRYPARNKVIVLLSLKAGLRACEISRLRWNMVLNAQGQVGDVMELPAKAAKKGSGRRIPLHPDLRHSLVRLKRHCGQVAGPVVRSERTGELDTPLCAKAIVNWFRQHFRDLGLQGCSSHSGRRTFVTRAARLIYASGGSLRDVQLLAGHRSIQTTQGYIDGSSDAQRRMIRAI
jgi:integrase